jgi:hypothetical protein
VVEDVPLALYVDLVADLPLPTQEQKENFVDYVSHVQSWYKGISPYPPGIPVHFFLDRHAGCDQNGAPVVTPRSQRGVRTDVYRTAFGYLKHSTDRKNNIRFFIPSSQGLPSWPPSRVAPQFLQPSERIARTAADHTLVYGLPEEIFDSGEARLTGAVHTLSAANPWVWEEDRRPDRMDWPKESGGRDTLELIVSRCRYLREPGAECEYVQCEWRPYKGYPSSESHRGLADRVLYELLAPERRRQHREMLAAIDRVCAIIESQRNRRAPA